MLSKKALCHNWKLYVITSKTHPKRSLVETIELAIKGGASVVQLRDKQLSDEAFVQAGKRLLEVTRRYGVTLIVNDRIEAAALIGADGVHLGQDDATLGQARRILGADRLIGRSTHSPEQAMRAIEEGFDYIGVGPVFATPTKPAYQPVGIELVRFAAKHVPVPFVAIGGIDAGNVHRVREAGARTVAVVRAVMNAKDPEKAAKELL